MGLDLRIITGDRVAEIADGLREHGFDVSENERTVDVTLELCAELNIEPSDHPVIVTTLRCQRDGEETTLSIRRDDEYFEGFRIYIPNLWSWQPLRNRKLRRFQSEVTAILEELGAYWPYDNE